MFDPFEDFATAGYLRNVDRLKDHNEVAAAQHGFFVANLPKAERFLRGRKLISYADFLHVHKILFEEFYPWAGHDRSSLHTGDIISKAGKVQFADAHSSQRAVEWGLEMGNNTNVISKCPGKVMGAFAFGHPFLDGNGRAMTVVHAELFHRAGFMIDWPATRKSDYLEALTRDIGSPNDGILDAYLAPYIVKTDKSKPWIQQLSTLPGLDGADDADQPVIAYGYGDKAAMAEYQEFVKGRGVTFEAT